MRLSVAVFFLGPSLAACRDTAQCSEKPHRPVLLQVSPVSAKTSDVLSRTPKVEAAVLRSQVQHLNKVETQHAGNTTKSSTHNNFPQKLNSQIDMSNTTDGAYAVQREILTSPHGKTQNKLEIFVVCVSVIVTLSVGCLVSWHMTKSGTEVDICTPTDSPKPDSPRKLLSEQQCDGAVQRDLSGRAADADRADRLGFDRRGVKASVLDTYAITSALLTGFGVCTTAIEHRIIARIGVEDPIRYWLCVFHQILIRLSTALALFSMLVFSLSTLYAKTALSSRSHACELYDWFLQQTLPARQLGFWFMYTSCILYMCAIALGCFYSLRDTMAATVSLSIFVLAAILLWYTKGMITSATVLYGSEEDQRAVLMKA